MDFITSFIIDLAIATAAPVVVPPAANAVADGLRTTGNAIGQVVNPPAKKEEVQSVVIKGDQE